MKRAIMKAYCRKCEKVQDHEIWPNVKARPSEDTLECTVCRLRTLEAKIGLEMLGCPKCGGVEEARIDKPHTCSRCGEVIPARLFDTLSGEAQ